MKMKMTNITLPNFQNLVNKQKLYLIISVHEMYNNLILSSLSFNNLTLLEQSSVILYFYTLHFLEISTEQLPDHSFLWITCKMRQCIGCISGWVHNYFKVFSKLRPLPLPTLNTKQNHFGMVMALHADYQIPHQFFHK